MVPNMFMNRSKLSLLISTNQSFLGILPTTQFRSFSAPAHAGEPRFLDQVQMFLARAAEQVDIDPDYYKLIESCSSVIRFNIPLRRDDGTVETIACYRAQHSTL